MLLGKFAFLHSSDKITVDFSSYDRFLPNETLSGIHKDYVKANPDRI